MASENERELISRHILPFSLVPKNVLIKRDSFGWIRKGDDERLKKMEKDIAEMKKEIVELRMMVSSPSTNDEEFLILGEGCSPNNPNDASPEEAPPDDN